MKNFKNLAIAILFIGMAVPSGAMGIWVGNQLWDASHKDANKEDSPGAFLVDFLNQSR